GLMDGGWYWINDMANSAVSPLIAKDALAGMEVMPTDPGGVDLSAGAYGSLVKHAASGRVGILPHFVPSAPVDIPDPVPATVCMPEWNSSRQVFYANEEDCMLGDGGTEIAMTRMTSDGRSATPVSMVHRNPRGGSDVEVALDLWGNGSGHVSHTMNPHLGWDLSVPSWYSPKPEPFQTNFFLSLDPNDVLGTGLSDAGVSLEAGRLVTTPGEPDIVPAPETGNDTATPAREDGFYMSTTTHTPQCVQNVHEVEDGAGVSTYYLQFQAASGSDPVNIQITGDDATGAVTGLANDASYDALATWVTTHNNTPPNTKIKVVSARVGVGADGVLADNADTADVDESADNTDVMLPAVVCATMPAPASESTTRYVGATISISPTTTYCNSDNNRTAIVYVLAYSANTAHGDQVTPMLYQHPGPGWRTGLNASTALQVHCPLE
ncbi:MAG: hypothetical protein OYL92_15725, partial [Acidobacteriota bacterium]|nr:hypothetical protein [Acidobacteriota bacterium]